MAELIEFFTDHPFATLFIGLLCGVVSLLIYRLVKKDVKDVELRVKFMHKEINVKFDRIKELLTNHITDTNKRIEHLEAGQAKLEKGQVKLEAGQANLEAGQAHINKRMDKLEAGQAKLEKGQVKLEAGQANLEAGQAHINKRIDNLESKVDKILEKL